MNDLSLYAQYRSEMLPGDIILYSGNGVIAKTIQMFSRNDGWPVKGEAPPNHAQTVCKFTQLGIVRVGVAEAERHGLWMRWLSDRLQNFDGRAYWLPVRALPWHREEILRNTLEMTFRGVPYDYKGLFLNMFGKVSMDTTAFLCSEFAWYNVRRVGLPRYPNFCPSSLSETRAWIYINEREMKKEEAPRPAGLPTLLGVKPVRIL